MVTVGSEGGSGSVAWPLVGTSSNSGSFLGAVGGVMKVSSLKRASSLSQSVKSSRFKGRTIRGSSGADHHGHQKSVSADRVIPIGRQPL